VAAVTRALSRIVLVVAGIAFAVPLIAMA